MLDSPDNLSNYTVEGIYTDVCQLITAFNDDLNQVSYKLSIYFTGYLHLYATYMILKKHAEIEIKRKNKPLKDVLNLKEA